ncbi:MAG: histidine phosphatase family protein [Methanoregulaceae archaeon]|nr:histidine phosphatase family protein [Methanoregulaceae archaeon]
MRLYLVRHGQTLWNVEGRAQGHADIELDSVGVEQARRLKSNLPEGVHAFSSDMRRALATAQAVTLRVTTDIRLRERNLGMFEGRSFTEFHEHFRASGKSFSEFAPPGGESFLDVWHRLHSFTEEVGEMDDDQIIVTHGGTGALLLAQLMQGRPETARAFRFGNTAVTELERRPDGSFVMLRYNDTSHLDEPAREGDTDGSR